MTKEEYMQSVYRAIQGAFESNLERVSIILESVCLRLWINYVFEPETVDEEDVQNVLVIETEVFADIPGKEVFELQIVSGIYQNLYDLRENEIVVFERGKDELALKLPGS